MNKRNTEYFEFRYIKKKKKRKAQLIKLQYSVYVLAAEMISKLTTNSAPVLMLLTSFLSQPLPMSGRDEQTGIRRVQQLLLVQLGWEEMKRRVHDKFSSRSNISLSLLAPLFTFKGVVPITLKAPAVNYRLYTSILARKTVVPSVDKFHNLRLHT